MVPVQTHVVTERLTNGVLGSLFAQPRLQAGDRLGAQGAGGFRIAGGVLVQSTVQGGFEQGKAVVVRRSRRRQGALRLFAGHEAPSCGQASGM